VTVPPGVAYKNAMRKSAAILTSLGFALSLTAHAQPQGGGDKWDIAKVDASKLPPASTKTDLTFDGDIEPLLKTSCLNCHGAQHPRGDLQLDTLEHLLQGGRDGKMVVPGDSAKSLLVAAAARISPSIAMPPEHHGRGPGGPGGPGGFGGPPPGDGGPGGPPPGHPPDGGPPPGPNGGPGHHAPPKPFTAEQVGLIRAWIDQGAK
jgi:hypothetical protein